MYELIHDADLFKRRRRDVQVVGSSIRHQQKEKMPTPVAEREVKPGGLLSLPSLSESLFLAGREFIRLKMRNLNQIITQSIRLLTFQYLGKSSRNDLICDPLLKLNQRTRRAGEGEKDGSEGRSEARMQEEGREVDAGSSRPPDHPSHPSSSHCQLCILLDNPVTRITL